MPDLSQLSGREVLRALERLGFRQTRQRGSHVVMKKVVGDNIRGCVVPMHRRVALGTLMGILKQAGVSRAEFESEL